MAPALITMAYRQIIDAASASPFEQEIFKITYAEFMFQQQSFSKGQDLFTWSAIKEKFPKSFPALPFKVSFAIAGLLHSLDKKIPGLEDTSGTRAIRFINYNFELIASDTKDRSAHKIAITYHTERYTLLYSIGNSLLLAEGDVRHEIKEGPVPSFLLGMQPGLSVCSYATISPALLSTHQVSTSLSP